MRTVLLICCSLICSAPLFAQGARLWVLQGSEMVEYDPATFAPKQKIKLPAEAAQSPQSLSVNRIGQVLFAVPAPLPLSEADADRPHKVWFWDGHAASTLDLGVSREEAKEGSNEVIHELSPTPALSVDGGHLFWFASQARRLQREDIDLSTTTTWLAWQTDLSGANRQDIAKRKFPDCRCATGTCDESCPYGAWWAPDQGVENFFLMTELIAGQTESTYQASTRYVQSAGKWQANPLPTPLERVLDANADGSMILEALPDSGCCGWSNESDDQTLLVKADRNIPIFDERATYKNPDYDVSFFTANAALSPDDDSVAMTVTATTGPDKPIQLADQGQGNPEELARIRKSLTELPAVEVKHLGDSPRRAAFVPHAAFVGWLSNSEILLIEEHLLIGYNVATGAKRRSAIRVSDAAHVFLR